MTSVTVETPPALSELYQEVILEHSRRPRFKGKPSVGCQFCQEGKNPLCGDQVTLFCRVDGLEGAGLPSAGAASGGVSEALEPRLFLAFEGHGCSISQASTSMLCEAIQGVTPLQARDVLGRAEDIYSGRAKPIHADDIDDDVEALFGVSKFPVRVKCAALPWKTFEIFLNEKFDENGRLRDLQKACVSLSECVREKRTLRVVSTED
jgi:nitrogen fixation NifU-like protein